MKHRNIIKVLSVTLAILAAVMFLPFGTPVAYATNDGEQMGILSTAETLTDGQDVEAQVIETEMETEIVCEDDGDESSKSPQASKDGEPQSTRSTQITTTGYIPDGVYALRNVANQNFWMDVQDDSIYPTAYIQQSSYSSNPADTFDRPALFKISRIPNTSRYVIRLMTNNRLSFYGTADKEAATMEISPRDTEVPINNTFYITYDSTGYVIQPYNLSSHVLAAQNTTSGGESAYPYSKLKFVSKSGSDNKARWQLYQYTGTTQSGTVIARTAGMGNGIVKGQSGTIWLKTWSTVIGVNTPYLSIDSAYSNIASLTWNASTYSAIVTGLAAGDLPITAHTRYDGTQTDYRTSTYNHVVIPDIVGDTAYVQNIATGKYMEVESASTATGGIVQQWSFYTQPQMKWIFELDGNGYFRIKSVNSGLYLGVNRNNTSEVRQYSTITDYMRWKIVETTSGNYRFVCKAAGKKRNIALSTPAATDGDGVDLTILNYTDDTNYQDEWGLYPVNYISTVNNFYDCGYFVRYGESEAVSRSIIKSYNSAVSQVYLKIFGLLVHSNGEQYYNSPIDQCKGTVSLSNIDTLCSHNGTIHTDRDNVISSFKSYCSGNETTTAVLWSCHKIKSSSTPGVTDYNRSCSSGNYLFIISISSANERDQRSQGSLLHELNHQYGAKDHYHDLADINDPYSCKFKDICSYCGTNPRPSTCIMHTTNQNISSGNIICSECQQDIYSHLNDHHTD